MSKLTIFTDGSCVFEKGQGINVFKKTFVSCQNWKDSIHYDPECFVAYWSSLNHRNTKISDGILPARPNFLFGADPEGFVVDATGKPVAPKTIPGTKEKPYKVDGGAIQRDGMAAEYNVDAANDFQTWNENHKKVQKALDGFLPKGHSMSWVPSVTFDEEVFANAPDEYKELGCSPDWNAWTEDLNPPPFCEDQPFLRTASGHIHIGWGSNYSLDDTLHQRNCFDFVKQLDWFIGGWSLKHDPDPTRRNLYGRAGACRLKSYGVEYRVLSNFWVTTEDRRKAVWNRLQRAIKAMEERFMPDRAPEGFNDKLIEAINSGKMEAEFRKACRFPFQTEVASYASF